MYLYLQKKKMKIAIRSSRKHELTTPAMIGISKDPRGVPTSFLPK